MLSRFITSLQHPIVKHLVKLREKKAYRLENRSVIISGDSLVLDLSKHFEFKKLMILEGQDFPSSIRAKEKYETTPAILKKILDVESPETMLAEIEIPEERDLEKLNYILVLDHISDPGNLGTLLRSALGLGFEGIFLLEGCCDPFNDKALRAAKGATFFLPIQSGNKADFLEFVKQHSVHVYVADLGGNHLDKERYKTPLALILGNETRGPDLIFKQKFSRIEIPINEKMESLNVAVAGAICMYTIRGKS